MLQILIIFALLFTHPSGETKQTRLCGLMISISDALPVQFWQNYCDTYNESEVCGIHDACWCQPFNCDDEIVLQFTDSEPLYLYVLNEDEEIIHEDAFTRAHGVNRYSFTPEGLDICDEKIALFVYKNPTQKITDAELTTGTNWDLGSGTGLWSISGGRAAQNVLFSSSEFFTDQLPTDFSDTDYPYRLKISARARCINGDVPTVSGTIYFVTTKDGVEVERFSQDYTIAGLLGAAGSESTYTIDVFRDDSIDGVYVYFQLDGASNPGSTSVQFEVFYVYLYEYTDAVKSDCLDIKTFHNCTKLIEYSNHRNFAGLNSTNVSPDETFYIRVPCRFFHQRFPEEADALELVDEIVITRQQLKAQKLLEVTHAPYYFHRKLKMVLMHRTVEIDNTLWKREEAYEINEGNKRWPLKSATCFLTEKLSVVRNVL
jgi:hypothetical protein